MEFIMANWWLVIIVIALAIFAVYSVMVFTKMPSAAQLASVREWLLYAVAQAEKELGSGTGQLKLRYVYDMFIARFPHFVKFIGFEAFSGLVDEALDIFREMLQQNKDVNNYIGNKEENNNG